MNMRFSSIVVSTENPSLPHELRQALKLVEEGGRVHVLHTTQDSQAVKSEFATAREGVTAIATPYPKHATLTLHMRVGDRAEETLRLAVEANADLVVVGASKRESEVVVMRVTSWAACSVLVLAPNREPSQSRGFVPLFPQCNTCAEIRIRESGRWFCDQHAEQDSQQFEALSS